MTRRGRAPGVGRPRSSSLATASSPARVGAGSATAASAAAHARGPTGPPSPAAAGAVRMRRNGSTVPARRAIVTAPTWRRSSARRSRWTSGSTWPARERVCATSGRPIAAANRISARRRRSTSWPALPRAPTCGWSWSRPVPTTSASATWSPAARSTGPAATRARRRSAGSRPTPSCGRRCRWPSAAWAGRCTVFARRWRMRGTCRGTTDSSSPATRRPSRPAVFFATPSPAGAG